jgi:cytidylate kinase
MSVIAIARGTLTATLKLSKHLSEELNYRLVTREEIYEEAKEYGIEETGLGKVAIVDQHPPSLLHRFTEKRKRYLICFQATLLDYALNDNLIYEGHLAHLLLSEYRPVLRIRLAATMEYRIEKLEEERGLSHDEATKLIHDIDNRRLKWSQFLYSVDWRDPVLYDLVLNPEKFSLETAGQAIIQCAKSKDFKPTAQDIEVLKNLKLQAVVQAEIFKSKRTSGLDVNVQADASAGEVRVYGRVPSVGIETWEKDLRTVISEVEGVKNIVITPSFTQYVD